MTISEAAKKLRAGGAYRMFVTETDKFMVETSELNGAVPSPETCKTWAMRFHTIKGGAGFFQLTEIADLAGVLERDFAVPNIESIWGTITENVEKMRVLVSEMPKPSQSES